MARRVELEERPRVAAQSEEERRVAGEEAQLQTHPNLNGLTDASDEEREVSTMAMACACLHGYGMCMPAWLWHVHACMAMACTCLHGARATVMCSPP